MLGLVHFYGFPRFSLFAERENICKCYFIIKTQNQNFAKKIVLMKMKNERILLLCQLVVSRGIDYELKQPFSDPNCP